MTLTTVMPTKLLCVPHVTDTNVARVKFVLWTERNTSVSPSKLDVQRVTKCRSKIAYLPHYSETARDNTP